LAFRGILAAVTCLSLLGAAGTGYFTLTESNMLVARSVSPISDAFAATDALRRPPSAIATAVASVPLSVVNTVAAGQSPASMLSVPADKPDRKTQTGLAGGSPGDGATGDATRNDAKPEATADVSRSEPAVRAAALADQPKPALAAPGLTSATPASPLTPAANGAAPVVSAALDSALSPAIETAKAALVRKCRRDVEIAAGAIIVSFEVNSAEISPVQLEQLKRFSGVLRTCPDVKLEVAGHTDLKGQQERNFGLSWARAEAVIKVLRSHGLTGMDFTPFGYGPRQPLSQNADTSNYSPVDRRVELIVR
jgi:outer membrane protein OmpA-like peptidoglycan-associated protein